MKLWGLVNADLFANLVLSKEKAVKVLNQIKSS